MQGCFATFALQSQDAIDTDADSISARLDDQLDATNQT